MSMHAIACRCIHTIALVSDHVLGNCMENKRDDNVPHPICARELYIWMKIVFFGLALSNTSKLIKNVHANVAHEKDIKKVLICHRRTLIK